MPDKKIIGKNTVAIPAQKPEIGIDTTDNLIHNLLDGVDVGNVNLSVLESFSNVAQTREEVYRLLDTMAQDDSVNAILETYAEDAVVANDAGKIIWCESSDEHVAKYVTYLLDSLNVDKNAYSWVFSFMKNGDLYLRLYRQSDYGDDLLFGKSSESVLKEEHASDAQLLREAFNEEENKDNTLNEDINVKVTDVNDHYVHYVEMVNNPGEMFDLQKFGKTMGYIKAPVTIQQNYDKNSVLNSYLNYKMRKEDVTVYSATDFVHACLQSDASRTPETVDIFPNDEEFNKSGKSSRYVVKRGQSLLYNSFKIWRELNLLENSMLLNRCTKSSIVRILNVDTGDMPKEKVNDYITRLKSKIEQKSALNLNESMTEYTNPGPIENIIYVPTHGTQGTISAQSIGGDVNPGELTDINYFQNKFYGSLRAPKQFFGQTEDSTGFNGGSSLTIISSRYGKAIRRIQNSICQAVTDVINLLLLDKGLSNYINKFQIRMQAPVTQEELDRREDMRNRIGVISDIMNQVNTVVNDDILKTKIVKVLLSSAVSDAEVIQLIQKQIDKMEEEQKETDTKDKKKNDEEEEENLPEENSFDAPSNFSSENDIDLDNSEEENNNDINLEPSNAETPETVEAPQEDNQEEEDLYMPSADELGVDLTNNNNEI